FVVALIDVVLFVGGGQHLAFVDVVDAQRLQHARLGEMADTRLGHNGDRDRTHDVAYDADRRHPRDAALFADIGGHALQRHHGCRAGIFGDLGLLHVSDVHNDAALEHLGQTDLQTEVFREVHGTFSMPAAATASKYRVKAG